MGILNYLPTFKQIEPDNLLGLTMGYVLAQRPVAYADTTFSVPTVTFGAAKFIENGIICGLDDNGKVVSGTTDHAQLFIHFTEELNTVLPGRKYFAVETEADETYLRLVALVPGSEWTTNVALVGDPDKATYDGSDKATYDALIEGGRIKELGDTTLPNGDPAKKYLFIK